MARSSCAVCKLEISRKSKCVGAKERELTALGMCRAETPDQDFEYSILMLLTEAIILLHFAIVYCLYVRMNYALET